MATRTSQLIVELLDRVSGPARRVSEALGGMRRAATGGPGAGGFSDRLNAALAVTNERLEGARAGVFDAVGAFYALRAAIASPVSAAMQLESAMADVKKVVNFTDEAEVSAFTQDLLNLTKTLPMTVEGLAQIAAAAGQAGIAKEDIIDFTEAAAKVGVAFDISADQAGEALAKMMTGLGMTLPEVIKLSDAMNHLSNAQASSAAEILDVVRRVGAMGKQYGFTAEQTAAFASAMIASGAQSDVAATSFMNMGRALTRGASATKRQRDAMQGLGLDAEELARRMQEDAVATTIDVMERIAALPAEMRAAVSSDLFGDEARALGPLLTNLDLVRESMGLVGAESSYAGSAFKEFEVRARTFQNRLQLFRNALSRVGIVIGNALLPPLTDLMNAIEPVLDRIGEWITANPKLVASLLAATAGLVAFRGAMAALRFAGLLGASGALSLLSAGMATVGVAAARLGAGARSAVALQTALGAMAGGQVLSALSKLRIGLWGAAMSVPGVSLLASAIGSIGAAVATISAPVWAAFAVAAAAVAAAGALVWRYWDRISAVMSGVGQAIGEILAPAIEKVRLMLDWMAPLGDAIAAGWERAKAAVAAAGEWLSGLFSKEVLSEEDKAAAKQAGYDFVMALWEGMKQVAKDLLEWVKGVAADILAPFAGMADKIKSYLPSAGSAEGVTSDPMGTGFEARAGGGPIRRGRPYIVGEEGPELITPRADGFVHTASETRDMLSGGGRPLGGSQGARSGGGVVMNLGGVTINAQPGQDAQSIAAEAVRMIEDKIGVALRGVQADTGMEAYG